MISLDIWQAMITVVGIAGGFFNVVAVEAFSQSLRYCFWTAGTGRQWNNRIAMLSQNDRSHTFSRNGYSNLRLSLTLATATIPGAI